MRKLTKDSAKEFALEKFSELPDLHYKWNILHAEGIIEVLKILLKDENINKEKLFALAWVHDIGKIISEKNHAELSLKILEKEFTLDEIDKDCILNHGSSGKPKTEEGKIFRYADGLSLFTREIILFRFFAEAKEGLNFEEIKQNIKETYEKYKLKYSDSKDVLRLLNKLYTENFNPKQI